MINNEDLASAKLRFPVNHACIALLRNAFPTVICNKLGRKTCAFRFVANDSSPRCHNFIRNRKTDDLVNLEKTAEMFCEEMALVSFEFPHWLNRNLQEMFAFMTEMRGRAVSQFFTLSLCNRNYIVYHITRVTKFKYNI